MKVIITKDYEDLSKTAAKILSDAIETNPKINLGLATGSTPIGLYKELVRMHNEENLDFSNVVSFNLDEYVGLDRTNENSYYFFMHDNLFNHVNIKKENINLPNGMSDDLDKELIDYQQKIKNLGGIEIQIDGLGENGHIGFNEPSDSLELNANVTPLTESTIEANSRFFENQEEVPTSAITLGMGNIFESKKIIIIANGEHKAEAVRAMVQSTKVTTQNPSTFLKLHPDVTIIVDEAAAKLL